MNFYHAYNVETQEIHLDKTAAELEVLIGISSLHVSSQSKNNSLFQGLWHVLNADSIPNPNHVYKVPLPTIMEREMLNNARKEYREKLSKAFRKAKEQSGADYYGKIYLLDDTGEIEKEFDTYKDAAEHLGLPIGTVQSRLSRVRNSVNYKFHKLCRSSDYEHVKKTYF